jgi:hypothetical protein
MQLILVAHTLAVFALNDAISQINRNAKGVCGNVDFVDPFFTRS